MKHRAIAQQSMGQLVRAACRDCDWKGPVHGNSVAGRELVRKDMAGHGSMPGEQRWGKGSK